jgi:hypothetical protein
LYLPATVKDRGQQVSKRFFSSCWGKCNLFLQNGNSCRMTKQFNNRLTSIRELWISLIMW